MVVSDVEAGLRHVYESPSGKTRLATKRVTMKAIVQDTYGPADVLGFRDIEVPVVGDEEVLVRVHAAGCGPHVWHFMTGMPYIRVSRSDSGGRRSVSEAGISRERSRRLGRT
jgi:hypothetical protein